MSEPTFEHDACLGGEWRTITSNHVALYIVLDFSSYIIPLRRNKGNLGSRCDNWHLCSTRSALSIGTGSIAGRDQAKSHRIWLPFLMSARRNRKFWCAGGQGLSVIGSPPIRRKEMASFSIQRPKNLWVNNSLRSDRTPWGFLIQFPHWRLSAVFLSSTFPSTRQECIDIQRGGNMTS